MIEGAPAGDGTVDPLAVYLRQIEAAALTREPAAELWRRIDGGCEEARRRLIAAHLPEVVRIVAHLRFVTEDLRRPEIPACQVD